ncbi:hypothetical protein HN499_05250 [archaeon]|jgi:hypothetical protein|nr:hypothetical protein [archaeon]
MKYSIIIPILILVTLSVALANIEMPVDNELKKEMLPIKIKASDISIKQEIEPEIQAEQEVQPERTLASKSSSKSSLKKKELEQYAGPIEIDFSPETDIQLTTNYHYWPSGILIEILQDEGELEMLNLDVFFNEGYLDMEYEIDDIVGGGYVEMENGTLAYSIYISSKDEEENQYTLFYSILESTISQYEVGDHELYGGIVGIGDSGVDFSTIRMFEEFDSDIFSDTRRHVIYLNEGLFRNPEPGELTVDVTHISTMDGERGIQIHEEQIDLEITEFTRSYCSMMYGMFEIVHNSQPEDTNYDARLDFNEDSEVSLSDFGIFASNEDNELWCAYQLTPF